MRNSGRVDDIADLRWDGTHERSMDCILGRYCMAFGKANSMGGVIGTGPLIAPLREQISEWSKVHERATYFLGMSGQFFTEISCLSA